MSDRLTAMRRRLAGEGGALMFDDYELRLTPLALFRAGRRVKLQRQPLLLLALLASRRGALVTHEEIRGGLWPDHVVDFARGTHVCVRQIRAALGDDAAEPRFVETVPREGYRFRAELRAAPPPATRRRLAAFAPLALAAGIAALAVVFASFVWPAGEQEPGAESLAADAYARGRFVLAQDGAEPARRSLRFFERAIAADPRFVEAFLAAAEARLRLQEFAEAEAMARAALALDPDLAVGRAALGRALALGGWRWEEARREFAAALALDEGLAEAHQGAAAVAAVAGRWEEALSHMARAHALDPGSTLIRADYGWYELFAGRPARAAELCAEALELEPASLDARVCVIRASAADGRHADALAHINAVMSQAEASESQIAAIAAAGEDAAVAFERWRLARYEDPARETPVSPALRAGLHAYVGDYDAALELLERSIEGRAPETPFIAIGLDFRPLAGDPRFQALADRLGVVVRAG